MDKSPDEPDRAAAETEEDVQEHTHRKAQAKEGQQPLRQQARCTRSLLLLLRDTPLTVDT